MREFSAGISLFVGRLVATRDIRFSPLSSLYSSHAFFAGPVYLVINGPQQESVPSDLDSVGRVQILEVKNNRLPVHITEPSTSTSVTRAFK